LVFPGVIVIVSFSALTIIVMNFTKLLIDFAQYNSWYLFQTILSDPLLVIRSLVKAYVLRSFAQPPGWDNSRVQVRGRGGFQGSRRGASVERTRARHPAQPIPGYSWPSERLHGDAVMLLALRPRSLQRHSFRLNACLAATQASRALTITCRGNYYAVPTSSIRQLKQANRSIARTCLNIRTDVS